MGDGENRLIVRARMAMLKGEQRRAAVLLHQALEQDFLNPTIWEMLHQLFGSGEHLDTFQHDFVQKYYPDRIGLLGPRTVCPRCGSARGPDHVYCGNCGALFPDAPARQPPQPLPVPEPAQVAPVPPAEAKTSRKPPPQSQERRSLSWLYFSFKGRIGRRTYLLKFLLPSFIITAVPNSLSMIAVESDPDTALVLWGISTAIEVIWLWPSLACNVKRWHDRDKSGWWILLGAIPVIGWLWAWIELIFREGTPGPNRYGERSW